MKRIIIYLILINSAFCFSQIDKSQEQREAILDAKKKEVYVGSIGLSQAYGLDNSFAVITEHRDTKSNNINVFFDFGQESGFFDIDFIINEKDEKFQIFSVVDALNYMKKLGWEYVDSKGYGFLDLYVSQYIFENTGNAIVPIVKSD